MHGSMYLPPLSKVNKIIIGIYVAVFLLSTIMGMSAGYNLVHIMGLSWAKFSQGYIHSLLTFPFIDQGLMTVIFNSLILWFMGSELELKWGTKFYLKFLAIATYGCGLVFLLLESFAGSHLNFLPIYGLAGTNLALIVAYALIYPDRHMIFMFLFPMKAKYFCLLLAGIELFMAFTASASRAALGHLIAMVIGFFFLKYQSLRARGLGLKHIWENHKAHQVRKKRGNLRLVKDDQKPNSEDPKYWQ